MKTYINTSIISAISIILILFSTQTKAGNFTWNGSSSTAWGTSTNWTPNGVPSTNDTVTIVTGSNQVYLSANTSVKQFTISSGTVNLQTYTLSISSTGNFNSGNINNGVVNIYSATANETFKGTQFGAKVFATGGSILLNGSVFNDSLFVVKKGTANDNGKGGNTFNKYVSITDSGTGYIVLSDANPDVFNDKLDVNRRGTGGIYVAHRGTGNQFNGDVKFNGGTIYSNFYGTATYSGNITLNGNVYFGYSGGSCSLSTGKTMSIGDAGISSGWVYFKNFVQQDSTSKISLTLTGSAVLYFESGSVFNDSVTASAPLLYLNGTRFNGVANLSNSGSSSVTSTGGCYFKKNATVLNNCSSAITYSLSTVNVDTFATTAVIQNNMGTLALSKALFQGNVTLKNTNTSTASDRFFISSTGQTIFKGIVTIDNNTSGMCFGNSGGTITLESTASLSFVSGFTGNITLKGVTQLGTAVQSFFFPSSSSRLILGPNTTFNGPLNYYGQMIALNGITCNSSASIMRYGNLSETSFGGNVFNGNTIIADSSTHSNNFYMAYLYPDTFNGKATFIQKGVSGVNLYPAYNYPAILKSDITITSDYAPIVFGKNTGSAYFISSNYQKIMKSGSFGLIIRKAIINKTLNNIILNASMQISDTLNLTKGVISSDSINKIIINDNCYVEGGSDSSFINGIAQKLGDDPFNFPMGDTMCLHPYHPIKISAPPSNQDKYCASYIHGEFQSLPKDSGIFNVQRDGYWVLYNSNGTSDVFVTLSWNHNMILNSLSNLNVVCLDSSSPAVWKNLGDSIISGDSINGQILAKNKNHSAMQYAIGNTYNPSCGYPYIGSCNRVINGNFEQGVGCPNNYSNNPEDFNHTCFWYSPSFATPDSYFSDCAPLWAYAWKVHSGSRSVGIIGIDGSLSSQFQAREYVEGELLPLTAGHQYYFEFFAKYFIVGGSGGNAVDKIGAYFSPTYLSPSVSTINFILTPTFESPSGQILNDQNNWVKVSGCYTATGNEKYIIIGFFNSGSNTTVEFPGQNAKSYYFIDDVFLSEIGVANISENTEYNCLGENYLNFNSCFDTQIANGDFSINWSPSTGLTPSTGQIVSAAPTSTTTYTATMSGPTGCSNTIATFSMTGQPTKVDLSNQTVSTNKSYSTSTPITIGGTLHITNGATLTFSGCQNVIMGPSSKITLDPGASLIISNSNLAPCAGEWQGIVASDQSSSVTVWNSSISGAAIAVNGPNGIDLSVLGSIFTNNEEDIDVLHCTSNTPISISYSYFLGNPVPPNTSNFHRRAISMTDISAPIDINNNHFEYSDYGIYGELCSMEILNNVFQNIKETNGVPAYAIFLKRVNVSIIGTLNDGNSFSNVQNCIYGVQSGFTAEGNLATDVDLFGYSLEPTGDVTFTNNTCYNVKRAVYSHMNLNYNVYIIENNLHINDDQINGNSGIYAEQFNASTGTGRVFIQNNFISSLGTYAIRTENCFMANISDNTIEVLQNTIPVIIFGIKTAHDNADNIVHNCITNTITQLSHSRGIFIEWNVDPTLAYNSVNGFEYGIEFVGPTGPTWLVKQNQLESNGAGIDLGDDYYGNGYGGNYPGFNSFIESGTLYVPTNQFISNSPWDTYTHYLFTATTYEYKDPNSDMPINNGFDNITGILAVSPHQVNSANLYPQGPDCIVHLQTEYSELPYEDVFEASRAISNCNQDSSAISWGMKYHIYRIMRSKPAIQGMDEVLDSFYLASNHSNFDKFFVTDSMFNLLQTYSWESDSSIKLEVINNLFSTLNEISPENDAEENLKLVYLIWLNSFGLHGGVLSNGEADTLNQIATSCPNLAGHAVFVAHAILAASNLEAEQNINFCSSPNSRLKISESIEKNAIFTYPNPARDQIILEIEDFSPESQDLFSLRIIDSRGCVMLNQKLLIKENLIELTKILNGVYFLEILKNGLVYSHRKIVVVK